MFKSFSWARNDLVATYGYSREFIAMCNDVDILNIIYKITGGF